MVVVARNVPYSKCKRDKEAAFEILRIAYCYTNICFSSLSISPQLFLMMTLMEVQAIKYY